MATKMRKAFSSKKGKAHAPAKKTEKKVQLKVVDHKELAARISGKDGVVEVLAFSSEDVIGHVDRVVSSGSIAIDKATTIGGLPFRRIVEVYGAEQVGKTTLVKQTAVNVQRMGGEVFLLDPENKWDLPYFTALGGDPAKLRLIQTKRTEIASKTIEVGVDAIDEILTYWIEHQLFHIPLLLIWDSVGGTSSKKEDEDGKSKEPGVPAREWARAMRRLGDKIAKAGALLLLVNQQYEVIGGPTSFTGPRKKTKGGGAIRYHSSLRIEMIRTGTLKLPSGIVVGIEGIARFFKNSLGVPRDKNYAIAYKKGFDDAWSLLDELKEARYIHVGGGRYATAIPGEPPVQWQGGFAELNQMLINDPALRTKLVTIYNSLP